MGFNNTLSCLGTLSKLLCFCHLQCSSETKRCSHAVSLKIYKLSLILVSFLSFQMFAAITRGVIHSLLQSPPDIEALRVYLLLPECSVYQKEEHYDAIVIPFSQAILRLSADAGKVLSESFCPKRDS